MAKMSNESHVQEYRQIIEKFAAQRLNQRVPNGLPQHAAILIETMFQHAAAEMRIFSGDCNETVFGKPSTIAAVCNFLSKPYAVLRILVQNEKDQEWVDTHPLVTALKELESPHGQVEIIAAEGVYSTDEANHFAVMDNDGYRFEFDHQNTKAVANFNEPEVAKELLSAFDSAFKLAKETHKPLFKLPAA